MQDSESVNEILRTTIPILGRAKNISKVYDIFKAKFRDLLRLLSVKKHREEKKLEKDLSYKTQHLEKEISTKEISEERTKKFNDLDQLQDKLQKLKENQAKVQMKKIKNYFAEANEGDPKYIKQLASSMKPNLKIKELENSKGETINTPDETVNEKTSFYKKLYSITPEKESITIMKTKYLDNFFKRNRNKFNHFHSQNDSDYDVISEYEVEKAILKLNKDSSPGPDGLTSNLYKLYSKVFIPLLTDLFNDIIKLGAAPASFNLAIIKLIPKKPNSIKKVSDLRPLSLINTDQKILSHVLANRIKPVCNALIDQHQYDAHFPKRDIHAAITKIRQYAVEMKTDDLICTLDFTKAFDSVDRKFILAMLDYLSIDSNTIILIKTMYSDTCSIIEVHTEFSESFNISRGLRQGCPLSALLFNLVMEPLLQKIQDCKKLTSSHKQKTIAYADDISICLKNASLNKLLNILEKFQEVSGLSINYGKSEILAKTKKVLNAHADKQIKIVEAVKILGVKITSKLSADAETKQGILEAIAQIPKFISKNSSLRATSINIETLILSKIIYRLRHFAKMKSFIKKMNSKIIDLFWLSKKHNVCQDIVHTNRKNCGLGLKNLNKAIAVAKILNLKVSLRETNKENFLKSRWFRELVKDLKLEDIEVNINSYNQITIFHFFNSYVVTEETKARDLYDYQLDKHLPS